MSSSLSPPVREDEINEPSPNPVSATHSQSVSHGTQPTAAPSQDSLDNEKPLASIDDDEPEWVREFSQSLPTEQERKQALASQFEEDDDSSIIDLVPDAFDSAENEACHPDREIGQQQKEKTTKKSSRSAADGDGVPLVVSSKLDESTILVQSADEGLDLSGDIGAVGRVKMHQDVLYLDIKGTFYIAQVTASNSACVVTVGDDEAKITSVGEEITTLTGSDDVFKSGEVVFRGDMKQNVDSGQTEKGFTQEEEDEVEGRKKKRKVRDK